MKQFVILLCITLMMGCEKPPVTLVENDVSLTYSSVEATATSQWLNIAAEGIWTATIEFAEGATEWAFLAETEGEGDALVRLNYLPNTVAAERALDIVVTFSDDSEKRVTMTQGAGTPIPIENSVELSTQEIAHNWTSNVAVTITSEMSWEATLVYGSGASGWANISKSEGSGNEIIQLTPTENSLQSQRAVTISVTFADNDTKTATLTQKGKPNTDIGGTTVYLELPEVVLPSDKNYKFVTHYSPLPGRENARNYSILYDPSTYSSLWVAYPMNKEYTSEGAGRNEDWAYDPKIERSLQTYLDKGYGGNSDAGVWSKGHQIASGDRQATKPQNRQTFYFTNMTPQKQDFNGVLWERLESNLQDWAKNLSDTLWCVTGPVYRTVGGSEPIQTITNRNDQKTCPVPNYYYKVIIRKSGNTYKGIGFWFAHNYNYSIAHFSDYPSMQDVKTIREIEELTGFNFYFNLSEADQNAAETSVDQSYWSQLFGR